MNDLDMGALKAAVAEATEKTVLEGAMAGMHGAVAKLTAAMGGAPLPAATKAPRKSVEAPVKEKRSRASKEKPVAKSTRPKGDKRTPDEMNEAMTKVYEVIKNNPGLSAEQLGERGFNKGYRDRPIKKLIAEKRIVTKGQKRATRYYPTGG